MYDYDRRFAAHKFLPELPEIKAYVAGMLHLVERTKEVLAVGKDLEHESRAQATAIVKKLQKLLAREPDVVLPPNRRGAPDSALEGWKSAREAVLKALAMWLGHRSDDKAAFTTKVSEALALLSRASRDVLGNATQSKRLVQKLEAEAAEVARNPPPKEVVYPPAFRSGPPSMDFFYTPGGPKDPWLHRRR